MSIRFLLLATLAITALSGAAATWLASQPTTATRRAVADRLAQIALLGAGVLFALTAELE